MKAFWKVLIGFTLMAAMQLASAQTFTPRVTIISGGSEAGQMGSVEPGDQITVRLAVDVSGASSSDGSDAYVSMLGGGIELSFTSPVSFAPETVNGWIDEMVMPFTEASHFRQLYPQSDRSFVAMASGPALRIIRGNPEADGIVVTLSAPSSTLEPRGAWCIPSNGACTIDVGDFTFTLPDDIGRGDLQLTYSNLGVGNYEDTVMRPDGASTTLASPRPAVYTVTVMGSEYSASLLDATLAVVGETNTYAVSVDSNVSAGETLTVPYTITASGTAQTTDYTDNTGGMITIASGASSADIMITVDSGASAGGVIELALGTPAVALGGSPSSTSTAVVNDAADSNTLTFTSGYVVSVEDATIAEGDTSDGEVELTVSVNPAPEREAIEVTLTPESLTTDLATADRDYGDNSQAVTFAVGETMKTVRIPIVADTIAEADETFTVTLGLNPAMVTTVSGVDVSVAASATPTVTIADDDPVVVTLGDAAYAVAGQTNRYPVTIGVDLPENVSVNIPYRLSANAADYVDVTAASVSISSGSRRADIRLQIPDTATEGNEITITLGAPTFSGSADTSAFDAPTLGAATRTVEITEGYVITVADASATETDAGGEASLTVSVQPPPQEALSVTLTMSTAATDNAVAGSDYTATTTMVNFARGDTEATVTVPILADELAEGDETFTVTLSNPAPALATLDGADVPVTANDTAIVTIGANDPIVVSLAAAAYAVTDQTNDYAVTIGVDLPDGVDVVVPYTLGGNAVASTDYTDASGGSVTIASGSRSANIEISVDASATEGRAIVLTLGAPRLSGSADTATFIAPTVAPAASMRSVEITDGYVVTIADAEVAESGGAAVVTVSVVPQLEEALTVTITPSVDAAATVAAAAGRDFPSAPVTASFAAGDSSVEVNVPINDDSVAEPDETFAITLSNPQPALISLGGGNVPVRADDAAVVTIIDNDEAPDSITITVTPETIPEAVGGEVSVTVAFDGGVSVPTDTVVTLSVAGGTATAGVDFDAELPTVFSATIEAETLMSVADAASTFTLTNTEDNEAGEGPETVLIRGVVSGSDFSVAEATVRIIEGLTVEEREEVIQHTVGALTQGNTFVAANIISDRIGSVIQRGGAPKSPVAPSGTGPGGGGSGANQFHANVGGKDVSWSDLNWREALQRKAYDWLKAASQKRDAGDMIDNFLSQALRDSDFETPLGFAGRPLSLWGSFGNIEIDGTPESGGVRTDFESQVNSIAIGIDGYLSDEWIAGLAGSYSIGDLDYVATPESGVDTVGDVEQTMISAHPYVSWARDGFSVWWFGGYGEGDYDFSETPSGGELRRARGVGVEQLTMALGGDKIFALGDSWDAVVRGKGLWSKTEIDSAVYNDGITMLPATKTTHRRGQLESEAGYTLTLANGSVRPYGLLGVRWDHGDGVEDEGAIVDAGAGILFEYSDRFTMDIALREQITSSVIEERTFSMTGRVSFRHHPDGSGLSLSLKPTFGAGGISSDWDSFDLNRQLSSGSAAGAEEKSRIESELGYGWSVYAFPGAGASLLKAYIRSRFTETSNHALGLNFSMGDMKIGVEGATKNGSPEAALTGSARF